MGLCFDWPIAYRYGICGTKKSKEIMSINHATTSQKLISRLVDDEIRMMFLSADKVQQNYLKSLHSLFSLNFFLFFLILKKKKTKKQSLRLFIVQM